MMRKILMVLCVLAFACSTALAVPARILPESSHYQGSRFYDEQTEAGMMRGRIDFAVYDTQTTNEFVDAGFAAPPAAGRFIYAYQIFNNYAASQIAIDGFTIGTSSGQALAVNDDSISYQDDNQGGVAPTDAYFSGDYTEATWEYLDNSTAILLTGDHSYIMVITSDMDYSAGNYQLKPAADADFPVPEIPEPATVAMLGLGGALALLKRRRG